MARLLLGILLSAVLVACVYTRAVKTNSKKFVPVRMKNGKPHLSLSTKNTDGKHDEFVTFQVPINAKTAILELKLNKDIFDHIKVVSHSKNGTIIEPIDTSVCHYSGHVKGDPHSLAILKTCDGLEGVVTTNNGSYDISPVPAAMREFGNEHFISVKDSRKHEGNCGVKDDEENAGGLESDEVVSTEEVSSEENISFGSQEESSEEDGTFEISGSSEDTGSFEGKHRFRRDTSYPTYNFDREERIVELMIITDKALYEGKFKSDKQAMIKYIIDAVHHLDSVYKSLNTRIFLTQLEMWLDENKSVVHSSIGSTLSTLKKYLITKNYRSKFNVDVIHLVSGVSFDSSTIGLAYVRGVCSNGAVGVDEKRTTSSRLGALIAHELGHNLGMHHDGNRPCKTCPYAGGCFMSNALTTTRSFSQCSVDDMNKQEFKCLYNKPTKLVTDPICGNGLIEEGEICDCGTEEECLVKDPCCEPTGCKLKSTSDCNAGECCDQCKFKSSGSECRAASGECDIAESCTGDSSSCPADVHQKNGHSCDNGTAHCFENKCAGSLNTQCEKFFGDSFVAGHTNFCYRKGNTNGRSSGNCGRREDRSYIKCPAEHAICGKLQCAKPGEKFKFYYPIPYGHKRVAGRSNGRDHCLSATVKTKTEFLGYVNDGTRCAKDYVCHNFECITLDEFEALPSK